MWATSQQRGAPSFTCSRAVADLAGDRCRGCCGAGGAHVTVDVAPAGQVTSDEAGGGTTTASLPPPPSTPSQHDSAFITIQGPQVGHG